MAESTEHKVHTESASKWLRCNLTAGELDARTIALTRSIDAEARIEEERKSVVADFKARAEKAKAETQALNQVVRNRYEMRDVECDVAFDFTACTLTMTRTDTGEVIETRKLNPHERERQAELFPPENEPKQE